MRTFEVVLTIHAECKSDAEELINDYTGEETHVEINSILEVKDEHSLSEEEVEALEENIKSHIVKKNGRGDK